MAALEGYALDVVLIALPEHTEGYRAMPLFLEPFCFACAPGQPLSNQPVVTESELERECLLLLEGTLPARPGTGSVWREIQQWHRTERRFSGNQPGDNF